MSETRPEFLRLSELDKMLRELPRPRESRGGDFTVRTYRHGPLRWDDTVSETVELRREAYVFEPHRLAVPREEGWRGMERYTETHDLALFWRFKGDLLLDHLPDTGRRQLEDENRRLRARIAKMEADMDLLKANAGWSGDNSPALGGQKEER